MTPFDGPRTWKWLVPGAVAAVLFLVGIPLVGDPASSDRLRWLGIAAVVFGGLASIAAGTNWWKLVSTHSAEMHSARKEADAITPRGYILHEAKSVHPDLYRMILGEQARRWGLVSGTKSPSGEPYAVLMSRPRVTEVFLVYFLRMSNKENYMPKRMLSDNDHSFDPHKIVTAYEMYDDVKSLLEEELKATRPMGENKPGYWLGEWDPISVGLDFGVDIENWDVDGEPEEDAASRVARGGSSSQSFIDKALEGLEQTAAMKAKVAQVK